MNLPTALSKFQIQEMDNEFYLYCELKEPKEILLKIIKKHSFKVEFNHIIINKITYNHLINKCYER